MRNEGGAQDGGVAGSCDSIDTRAAWKVKMEEEMDGWHAGNATSHQEQLRHVQWPGEGAGESADTTEDGQSRSKAEKRRSTTDTEDECSEEHQGQHTQMMIGRGAAIWRRSEWVRRGLQQRRARARRPPLS